MTKKIPFALITLVFNLLWTKQKFYHYGWTTDNEVNKGKDKSNIEPADISIPPIIIRQN